jgi:hypothetical protein
VLVALVQVAVSLEVYELLSEETAHSTQSHRLVAVVVVLGLATTVLKEHKVALVVALG